MLISLLALLLARLLLADAFNLNLPWRPNTLTLRFGDLSTSWYGDAKAVMTLNELSEVVGISSSNDDCLFDVASALRYKCDGRISMTVRERSAVTMALCQLSSGGLQNIPLECHGFREIDYSLNKASAPEVSECLGKLQSIHPAWTSYMSMSVKMPDLCVTLAKGQEIAVNQAFAQNTTLERLSLIKTIKHVLEPLDILADHVSSVAASADSLKASASGMTSLMHHFRGSVDVFLLKYANQHAAHSREASETLRSVAQDTVNEASNVIRTLATQNREHHELMNQQAAAGIQAMTFQNQEHYRNIRRDVSSELQVASKEREEQSGALMNTVNYLNFLFKGHESTGLRVLSALNRYEHVQADLQERHEQLINDLGIVIHQMVGLAIANVTTTSERIYTKMESNMNRMWSIRMTADYAAKLILRTLPRTLGTHTLLHFTVRSFSWVITVLGYIGSLVVTIVTLVLVCIHSAAALLSRTSLPSSLFLRREQQDFQIKHVRKERKTSLSNTIARTSYSRKASYRRAQSMPA